ncbi:MAG: hypothetical protein KAR15_11250, partial [Desulfobacterales bacterium]|nr:hypothetical protein [Desulfobacterales bacterium]
MKRYTQHTIEFSDHAALPFWKRAGPIDRVNIGYGLFVVSLVVISYILGATHFLPFDPQEINMGLLMAPPNSEGHLLGTDFVGRDILSRLIIGIQAYFLPGLLAIAIALILGTCFGVLAGYWGGALDIAATYLSNLLNSFPRLVLILLMVAAFKPDIYLVMTVVGITNVPTVASLIKSKIQFLKQKNF